MESKAIIWLAVIVILVAVILLVVAIIVIHNNKQSPESLERGLIWLYIATAATFIAGFMTAVAAELRPNICQLPYSGKYISADLVSGTPSTLNEPNVIVVPRTSF